MFENAGFGGYTLGVMNPNLHLFVELAMYLFVLASLFGAGLGLTIKEIIAPLKNARLVGLAVLANFALIPLLAYCLSLLFKADLSLQTGLIIISCCAGETVLPRLMTIAKGSMAHTIGVMTLLMVGTVIFAPIILPLAIPGVSIQPLAIAVPLITLMLLPLALGLGFRAWRGRETAELIRPLAERTATVSLIVVVIFALLLYSGMFAAAWGTGVYRLAALFTLGALLIGYIFSGPGRHEKLVMTLGSGARNIAAALIVVETNFSDPRVMTVVLIGSLIQFIILFILARVFARSAFSRRPD